MNTAPLSSPQKHHNDIQYAYSSRKKAINIALVVLPYSDLEFVIYGLFQRLPNRYIRAKLTNYKDGYVSYLS